MPDTPPVDQFVFLTSRHLGALTTRGYLKYISINEAGQHEVKRVGPTYELTGVADDAIYLLDPKVVKHRTVSAAWHNE